MVTMVMATKLTSCSLLATSHQPFQRARFRSSSRKLNPVPGAASGAPVTGEARWGTWTPIP